MTSVVKKRYLRAGTKNSERRSDWAVIQRSLLKNKENNRNIRINTMSFPIIGKKIIGHQSPMKIEKSQSSGQCKMPETASLIFFAR